MGKIAAEGLQILDPRASPAIDGLIVITHGKRRTVRPYHQFHPGVLDRVGVLEFIDEHVAEAPSVVRQQFRVVTPKLERTQQKLRKIHHASALAGLLVILIKANQLLSSRIIAVFQRFGPQPFVLVLVDEVLDVPRNPPRIVEILRLDDFFDDAQLIVAVEDLEALRQLRLAPMQTQQSMGNAVKGADPERGAGNAEQAFDTRTHLAGGLVGEGHCEDAVRRSAFRLDEPGDTMHEYAGLAAASACQHQHRTDRCGDCLALGIVEGIKDRGEVHRVQSGRKGGDSTGFHSSRAV